MEGRRERRRGSGEGVGQGERMRAKIIIVLRKKKKRKRMQKANGKLCLDPVLAKCMSKTILLCQWKMLSGALRTV